MKALRSFLVRPGVHIAAEIGAFIGWVVTASYAVHQSKPLIVAGVGIYLVFNILRVVLDRLNASMRLTLKGIAIRELLKFFTMSTFGVDGSKAYRSTVLLPTADGQYLRPKYRYEYGAEDEELQSTAKFEHGCALAGFAWSDRSKPFMKDDIGPFQTEADAVRYYKEELKMRDSLISGLSEHVRNDVRSILCIALVDHNHRFLGVLSLDSTKPKAFVRLKQKRLEEIRSTLAAMLEKV